MYTHNIMVSEASYEFNKKSLDDLENKDIEKTSIINEDEIDSTEEVIAHPTTIPIFAKFLSIFGDSVEMNGIEPIRDEERPIPL